MDILHSGFIWFGEGILLVLALTGIKTWCEDRGVRLRFWSWIPIVLWLFLFGFTCTFIGTSLGEGESVAAVKGGIILGLITLISAAGIWRFLLQLRPSAPDPNKIKEAMENETETK